MVKIGLVHYNFPGSLDEFLDFSQDTGFKYMELMTSDVWGKEESFETALENAKALRKKLDDRGLAPSALAAQNDFLVTNDEAMDFQVARFEQVGQLARILGTDILRVDGGWAKDGVAQEQWMELMVEGFRRVRKFVEDSGFKLALDNHGLVTNNAGLQIELFEKVGSPNMGANLDTMNYRWAGHELDVVNEFYQKIAPHVLHCHLKDGRNSRADYVGTALGEGEINLKWAVQCLKEANYQGAWCVEFEGRQDHREGFRKGFEWIKANV